MQYSPVGTGVGLVSAGDRHSDAGRNPVRHGGGLVDGRKLEVQRGFTRIRQQRTVCATDAALRQQHQRLLDALVVALEHVDHDLEVGQRLRQRVAHIAEHRSDRVGGRRGLPQPVAQRLILRGASARRCVFRFAAQRSIASPELTWLSRIGAEFVDDVVDVADVRPEVTDDRLRVSRPAAAATGPTRRPPATVSSSSAAIFSFGSTASPWLAASSAGPISLGTVPLVMVCPSAKYWPGCRSDTRSRYCSPIADTECTLADASTGILYWSLMLIVARAPLVGRLDAR